MRNNFLREGLGKFVFPTQTRRQLFRDAYDEIEKGFSLDAKSAKDVVAPIENMNMSKPLFAWEYKSLVEQYHEMNAKPFRLIFSKNVLSKYPGLCGRQTMQNNGDIR